MPWIRIRRGRRDTEERRLWDRARSRAEECDLPRPFDVEVFLAALAERRGRPIVVLPVVAGLVSPCGMVVGTDHADYILCTADSTGFHRRHILLHEAAHLMCGHDRRLPARGDGSVLLPDLPPELVGRVWGRTGYADPEEREAELLASFIHHRAGREAAAPDGAGGAADRAGVLVGAASSARPATGA
ncbi:ParH-like protein [Streptomyces sp. CRN 30]|uniref:ParH-like protein n=1 Tax=Streptomyces sp. CRN 30 TaxID=3075613 RepID=UPI002A83E1AD|nr:ParH-like protein [Streptomyces sp. CRN 30]